MNAIKHESNAYDWDKLIDVIMSTDRNVHISHSFVGNETPDPEPKPKKERTIRQKAKLVAMKQLENVDKLEKNEKGARMVGLVLEKVRQVNHTTKQPIPFYDLIMDPDDYMTTIDNAFQIAFLARDGELGVECDNKGNKVVTVVPEDVKKAHKNVTQTSQAVLTIGVEEWVQMAEKYKNKEPMLKLNRTQLMKEAPESSKKASKK